MGDVVIYSVCITIMIKNSFHMIGKAVCRVFTLAKRTANEKGGHSMRMAQPRKRHDIVSLKYEQREPQVHFVLTIVTLFKRETVLMAIFKLTLFVNNSCSFIAFTPLTHL